MAPSSIDFFCPFSGFDSQLPIPVIQRYTSSLKCLPLSTSCFSTSLLFSPSFFPSRALSFGTIPVIAATAKWGSLIGKVSDGSSVSNCGGLGTRCVRVENKRIKLW